MIQQRTILTVGVDPSHCSLALDRADCEIVVLADPEAALDELWQHDRQVVAVAIHENEEPDNGFSTLVEVLERHWPDIELVLVPPKFAA